MVIMVIKKLVRVKNLKILLIKVYQNINSKYQFKISIQKLLEITWHK